MPRCTGGGPDAAHLTAFYLAMAVGGVLGGMFCAILAPTLFDWAYEHPLLIVAAALLMPQSPFIPWAEDMPARLRWLLVIGALASVLGGRLEPGPFTTDGTALIGSILISLVALAFIGFRWAFALGLPP